MMETTPLQAASSHDHGRPPRSLDAPALSRRSVALANRLSVRRRPIAFSMGDAVLSFYPAGLKSISSEVGAADLVGIGLRVDGRSAVLRLSAGLFERILERIEPELLVVDLHDEFLPLLLESCITDTLTVAEATYQGRIELQTIERDAAIRDNGLDILFEIAINGDAAGKASLHIDETGAERLAKILATSPRVHSTYKDLKAELSFRAGVMWLDLGELRSLKVGDVLLADEDAAQANEIAATLGETWLLNAEFTDAGLTLTKPLRLATEKDRDLWMMVDNKQTLDGNDELSELLEDGQAAAGNSQPKENPNPNPGPKPEQAGQSEPPPAHQEEDAGFDDVPIKLVFELGRVEISLGRLQELGPGHVFELDRPIGEAVEVFAGGRRVGQGEVVKIDEQVGVRMVRLFGHG